MSSGGAVGAAEATALSPSDLERAELQGSLVRVGGRLLRAGERWRLVDALGSVELEPRAPWGGGEGALAVVTGRLRGNVIGEARLESQQSAAAGATLSEFERVAGSGLGRRLRLRSHILQATRAFFEARGFLEVDTLLRVAECSPEPQIDAFRSEERYLVTSPELQMKRLLVGGVPRLFQLAHCFRADELGALHAPEFMLLEWYRAFAGVASVMEDTEALLCELCQRFQGGMRLALAGGGHVDVTPPFERLALGDAFRRFAGVLDAGELSLRDEGAFFQALVDAVEPGLAALGRPVFLCEFPASQAALARLKPGDPSVAERFELYLGGIELCNGYGELNDAHEQRARFERDRKLRLGRGRSDPPLPSRFLAALEQGMPPAAGNALGMERLMMLLSGEPRIDRLYAFPEG